VITQETLFVTKINIWQARSDAAIGSF